MQVFTVLRSIIATAIAVSSLSTSTVTAQQTPCVSLQIDSPATGGAIQDGTITTAIVKLNEEFAANPPASVEIDAPGIKCGRTTFTFNKGDRASYEQRVTCRTDTGSAPAKDGTVIDMPVTCKYTGGSRPSDTHTIKRKVVTSGRCSGTGDPHLTTLDGVAYDFQVQGVFRLFEANNFQVQIFQEKCGPVAAHGNNAPSCYQGVSVAFGGSIAKFFIENSKISVAKGSVSLQWLSIEKLGGAADGYRVFTSVDPSTYVDINLGKWERFDDYPYLNVAVQVSPYFKNAQVAGLMGNWNGNAQDDLTDNTRLAELHAAPLANNLFTCMGDACTPLVKAGTVQDSMAISLQNNQPILHQGYSVVASDTIPLRAFAPVLKTFKLRQLTSVSGDAIVHANANTTATKTDAVIKYVSKRATQLCNQVMKSIRACTKYVPNTDVFINNLCIADAVLLGDLSVVDSTKLNYLRECRRELDARLASKTACASETKSLQTDRASLQFGDLSQCAKGCSRRGQCLAAGCKCDSGFTGHGCDIAI